MCPAAAYGVNQPHGDMDTYTTSGKRDAPELLTTTEAAGYLSTKPHTLEIWRCTRRYALPYIKVGRNIRYRREDLDAFLRTRTEGVAA